MSAIAALVAPGGDAMHEVRAMLGAAVTPYDAPDVASTYVDGAPAALGARITPWASSLAGPALAQANGVVVALDGALYYQDELRRRIRGHVEVAADADGATLVAAAYAMFGDRLAEHLDGDLALIVWDPHRGVLVAARDFMGRHPLYVARSDDHLALASHPRMLRVAAAGADDLNVLHVAGRAAGLLEAPDTAYAGIVEVRAGHTLVARVAADGRVVELGERRHWSPPTFERFDGRTSGDAALGLRDALERATVERLAPAGPTAVWLSGGYDSPAVFASGAAALQGRGDGRAVRAVSMRYPAGDPGNEDERIAAAAKRWDAAVAWQDVDDVPLFADDEAVARRAGPFAHAFECWMAALARRAREVGARVVLDGSGGDQLFQVSPMYVADLVRRGRWLEARRELRATGLARAGWRRIARTAVLPLLLPVGWPMLARLRGGRPVRGLRAGVVPAWIRSAWRARLTDRLETTLTRRAGESCAAMESRWYFETTYSPTVFAEQTAIVRAAGVEVRSPLYDDRVISIAATRPRRERAHMGETKRLLRAALDTRLPAVVLGPRTARTGTTDAYFRRRMARELPAIVSRLMLDPALADLGVLDPALFVAAVERYLQANDGATGAAIFATVQAERWLRARR